MPSTNTTKTNTQSSENPLANALPFARRKLIIICFCLLLPISFILAIALGSVNLPFTNLFQALFSFSDNNQHLIVQQIRLPRALLALLVGALLGICGAATQGLFRNPLADPSLIGVTAGASTGAALTMFLTIYSPVFNPFFGLSLVSIGAFLGGVITVLLVYRLATNHTGTSIATMLLAGIAITAIAGGITSLLQFFSDNFLLRQISLWQMGGFNGANYQHVYIALAVSLFVLFSLPKFSTALNALLLGESEARHLGIDVEKAKLKLILLICAGVGSAVALSGSISFVGLLVPHIVRLLIGSDHRYLLPVSAIGGAILLLLADTFARTIIAPSELPVGLVTALLGAPFFISLLRHRHDFGLR